MSIFGTGSASWTFGAADGDDATKSIEHHFDGLEPNEPDLATHYDEAVAQYDELLANYDEKLFQNDEELAQYEEELAQNNAELAEYDEILAEKLSPPPPELPTWDTIPFCNLPEVLGPSFAAGYELRPGPRIDGRRAPGTWLDQDGTATYNPDCKRDPYLHPPVEIFEGIKRRRPIASGEGLPTSKVPKIITWQRGRFEGKRLPLTISFKNQEGRDLLAKYGSSLDCWPKSAWRAPDEEIDWESWWRTFPPVDDDGDDDSPDSLSAPRERSKIVPYGQDYNGNTGIQALEEITLGHPEARGCKGCFELSQRCPLLDEWNRYPCDICVEDGCDCELILQPAKKRGCLNCGHKRISCSYREVDTDHSLPCSNCATKGMKCIAGPASGRTRSGPALDSVMHSKVQTIRQAFDRNIQRPSRRRVLNKSKTRIGSKRDALPDAVEDGNSDLIRETKGSAGFERPDKGRLEELWGMRVKPSKDQTQYIRTQLAHPIVLNGNDKTICHWCRDDAFGIFGLGPVLEVEVLDMNDGEGYTEVSQGYKDGGEHSSYMCTACTMDRLEIAACLEHQLEDLKEIDGFTADIFDPDYVMEFLMPDMAASAPFEWCSVCPNAALYTCCKPTVKDVQTLLGEREGIIGCGLKLCENCALALIHDVGGDLDALVQAKELLDDDFSLRADVTLILRGGEIVRRLGWMFTLGADVF